MKNTLETIRDVVKGVVLVLIEAVIVSVGLYCTGNVFGFIG